MKDGGLERSKNISFSVLNFLFLLRFVWVTCLFLFVVGMTNFLFTLDNISLLFGAENVSGSFLVWVVTFGCVAIYTFSLYFYLNDFLGSFSKLSDSKRFVEEQFDSKINELKKEI